MSPTEQQRVRVGWNGKRERGERGRRHSQNIGSALLVYIDHSTFVHFVRSVVAAKLFPPALPSVLLDEFDCLSFERLQLAYVFGFDFCEKYWY